MSDDVTSLLRDFAKRHGVKIVSDGDLDGIFATGLLVRYFRGLGFDVEYSYPKPDALPNLKVSGCILVELPLTKGLVYVDENVLVDHHEGPARIELLRNSKIVRRFTFDHCRSVVEVVCNGLGICVRKDLLDAINDTERGVYSSQLAEFLHKAYLLNIFSSEMRIKLTELVSKSMWEQIVDWAKNEYGKWENLVEPRVKYFVDNVEVLIPSVVYFTYREEDAIDKAARSKAMFLLEDKYDIVISIGLDKNSNAISARIATKRPIDLTPVFEELRKMGYLAGGRKNVGGVRFGGIKIEKALEDIKKALTLAKH